MGENPNEKEAPGQTAGENYGNGLSDIIAFVFSAAFVIAASKIFFSIPQLSKVKPFTDTNAWGFLTPEPAERFVYLAALVIFPLAYFLIRKFLDSSPLSKRGDSVYVIYAVVSLVLFAGAAVLFAADFSIKFRDSEYNYFYRTLMLAKPVVFTVMAAAVCLVFFVYSYFVRMHPSGSRVNSAIALPVDLAVLFIIITVSFENVDKIKDAYHFEAVYYSMAQVFNGNHVLVDFSTQYGLYAHFLKPIIILMGGLTIWNFKVVMACLIAASLTAFYLFMRNIIKNKLLLFTGFFAVVFMSYSAFYLDYRVREYYQYFPLRTLFPSFFLLAASYYFKKKTPALYYAIPVWLSAGVLWNPDTGIIALVSWICVLIYDEVSIFAGGGYGIKKTAWKIYFHLSTIAAIAVSFVILYSVGTFAASGVLPDMSKLTLYQRIYYAMGFGAMPMQLIHPWNMVVLVLTASLSAAISGFIAVEKDEKSAYFYRVIFLLAVFGLGIFTYYQGRSHDWALVPVLYVPLIAMVLFAGRVFDNIKAGNGGKPDLLKILACYAVIFVILAPFTAPQERLLKFKAGDFMAMIKKGYVEADVPAGISSFFRRGEPAYVISDRRQALIYGATGAVNPINVPGQIEMTLVSDVDKVRQYLAEEGEGRVIIWDRADGGAYTNHYGLKFNENYKIYASFPNNHIEIHRQFKFEENPVLIFKKNNYILHAREFGNYVYSRVEKGKLISNFVYDSGEVLGIKNGFTLEALMVPAKNGLKNIQVFGCIDASSGFSLMTDRDAPDKYRIKWNDGKAERETGAFDIMPEMSSYVVISYGAGTIKVFVNGEKVQESRAAIIQGNTTFRTNFNWNAYSGRIPEMVVSKGASGDDEIRKKYRYLAVLLAGDEK